MNFDPMTGEPIKQNFDPMTGEPVKQNFDPMTGQPIGMPPKKKGFLKSKTSKIILAIVVCAIGIYSFSNVFASKPIKVLKAIKHTFTDYSDLTQAFGIKNLQNIAKSDEYTVAISLESEDMEVDASYLEGKKNKQVIGSINQYSTDIDFTMNLTKDELQVQLPLATDKIITYDYKGENTGYLMDELDSDQVEAVNKLLEYVYDIQSNEKAMNKFKKAVQKEYKSLQFESVEKETFEVNGKDRSCKGYETVITNENARNLLDAYEESVGENLNEMEELMSTYEAAFEELREALEEMPDIVVTFYIYDKKLACVEVQPEDQEAIQIQFLGGDKKSKNVRIVVENNAVCELAWETTGSEETIEFYADEESVFSFCYDNKSGDFDFSSDEFGISGNIESNKKEYCLTIDRIYVDDEAYDFAGSISIKKGADFQKLKGEKFDIGNASESEIEDLIEEIQDIL